MTNLFSGETQELRNAAWAVQSALISSVSDTEKAHNLFGKYLNSKEADREALVLALIGEVLTARARAIHHPMASSVI